MDTFFIPIFFGWPAVLLSLFFGGYGILRKKGGYVLIGCLWAIPHADYLSGSPLIGLAAYLLPVAYLGAIIALRYNTQWLAWTLLFPQLAVDLWLAYSVFNR